MGNTLRCLEGGADDHAGAGDRYPYYRPTSGLPRYQLQGRSTDVPSPPPTYRRVLAHHDVAALDQQYNLDFNFKPTSMPDAPTVILQSGWLDSTWEIPQIQRKTYQDQDIDESSAEGLRDAQSYVTWNPMLIQVPVLGTSKKFWRLSDEATRISRNLALILSSHHLAGKYLTAPLQLSNVWVSSSGSVKLRGVRFGGKRFSLKRVRDDYRGLARVLQALVRVSDGDVAKLPPDYKDFLTLLASDAITLEDEFFIVNHPALLPMSNRTEVFLVLYDRLVTTLDRTPAGRKKKRRILSKLPYEQDWLDTAQANTEIRKYVVGVQKQYKRKQLDQLRLNRNVRCHLHQYNDEDIEQVLYCEWPQLLTEMAKRLHEEGELQSTGIQEPVPLTLVRGTSVAALRPARTLQLAGPQASDSSSL